MTCPTAAWLDINDALYPAPATVAFMVTSRSFWLRSCTKFLAMVFIAPCWLLAAAFLMSVMSLASSRFRLASSLSKSRSLCRMSFFTSRIASLGVGFFLPNMGWVRGRGGWRRSGPYLWLRRGGSIACASRLVFKE